MNPTQLEGMRARAQGVARTANPHDQPQSKRDWLAGYDLMDSNIHQVLENAEKTLRELEEMRASAKDPPPADRDAPSMEEAIDPPPRRGSRRKTRRRARP